MPFLRHSILEVIKGEWLLPANDHDHPVVASDIESR